jgi:hypothetical protein
MVWAMAGLIITNGDSAADLLRAAGRIETIVAWRDVLHEGPIAGMDLIACSAMRVPYLASRFGLTEAEVAAEFADRDSLMLHHGDFAAIELWFEHDLYDQLQLLQVLAFFQGQGRSDGVTLVQADDFLGRQTARTILRFASRGRPVGRADLDYAGLAWRELASPTPEAVADRIVNGRPAPLPLLVAALRRFLEELPSPANGLGRTEQTILDLIATGTADARSLFADAIVAEQAAFMGDLSFFRLIDDLAMAEVPLIAGLQPPGDDGLDAGRFDDADLSLTMAGDDVRAGEDDHVALSGIDRWWGGTRLLGRLVWRYDRDAQRLVRPDEIGA